jgi:hypothetical protein
MASTDASSDESNSLESDDHHEEKKELEGKQQVLVDVSFCSDGTLVALPSIEDLDMLQVNIISVYK